MGTVELSLLDISKPATSRIGVSRVYTIADNFNIYSPHTADAKYFKKNPKRHVYIRQQVDNEFDVKCSVKQTILKDQPTLFVAVFCFVPSVHIVYTAWRGKPFFKISKHPDCGLMIADVDSDEEASVLLVGMDKRGGCDEATSQWELDVLSRLDQEAAQASIVSEQVH